MATVDEHQNSMALLRDLAARAERLAATLEAQGLDTLANTVRSARAQLALVERALRPTHEH